MSVLPPSDHQVGFSSPLGNESEIKTQQESKSKDVKTERESKTEGLWSRFCKFFSRSDSSSETTASFTGNKIENGSGSSTLGKTDTVWSRFSNLIANLFSSSPKIDQAALKKNSQKAVEEFVDSIEFVYSQYNSLEAIQSQVALISRLDLGERDKAEKEIFSFIAGEGQNPKTALIYNTITDLKLPRELKQIKDQILESNVSGETSELSKKLNNLDYDDLKLLHDNFENRASEEGKPTEGNGTDLLKAAFQEKKRIEENATHNIGLWGRR